MPDVQLALTGTQHGSASLEPASGALVRIVPLPGTELQVGVDYESPDRLLVNVGGSFTILHDSVTVSGQVAGGVFDGKTTFTGSVTYDISKDVSATISASIGPDGGSARAGLTIRF